MDRNTLLPRLTRMLIAAVLLSVPVVLTGCGSTSQDEYRTVTAAETETGSDTLASQPQVQQAGTALSMTGDSDDPVDPETTAQSQQDAEASDPVLPEADSVAKPNNQTDSATIPPAAASPATDAAEALSATTPIEVPLADPPLPNDPGAEALVRPIKLLVPEQTFSVEGPNGALRISYDDFDIEKVLNVTIPPPDIVKHFPDWLAGLDGQRVRVRGFMYPTFQETGLGGFVLARDYGVCCFGPQGKIYHLVEVAMRKGETTDYIHARPFDVVGEFHIRPDADGDELLQLYQIEDAVVIDD